MNHTKKIVSAVGTLLMIISFVFIIERIMQYDIDFSILTSPWVTIGLLLLSIIVGLGYLLVGIAFQWLLESLSGLTLERIERRIVVKFYCIANLYKYIPGGILYVVGRNRLAFETDKLTHTKIALGTLIEGIVFAITGFVIAIVFAYNHFIYYIRQMSISPFVWIIVGGFLFICVLLTFIFRQAIRQTLSKYIDTGLPLTVMPKFLGAHILMLFTQAVTFPLTLMLLGQSITLNLAFTIIGLYALSWVAGYLTPGAPNGLGIREAVMLMFLGGILDEGMLLSSIVIHRAVSVVGDVFIYGVGLAYVKPLTYTYNKRMELSE